MEYILVALTVYLLYYLKNKYWQPAGVEYRQNTFGDKQINTNKTCYLALIVLILFFGLRDISVGIDTRAYYTNFVMTTEAGKINAGYGYGFLYQLITLLSGKIFGLDFGFNVSLIIYGAIICFCVDYALKQTSKDMPLAMFMFASFEIYLRAFNQMRQGISIAILMIAFVCIVKKKPIHFICLVIIATMFHKSAIAFLIFYPICRFKNTTVYIYVISCLSIIFAAFHLYIMEFVTKFYGREYFTSYLAKTEIGYYITFRDFAVLIFGLGLSLILLYYLVKKCKENESTLYRACFSIYLLYPLIKFIGIINKDASSMIYNRLTTYFSWAILLFVPTILLLVKNNTLRKFLKAVIVIVCLMGSVLLCQSNGLLPYSIFWS